MKKKQFRTWLPLLCILLVLLLTMTAYVAGKYITQIEFNGSVTFTTSLASKMELLEHKAVRQSNGTYTLGDETVTGNTYILMPGVDVAKDPYIVITGKTPIPAYLYIEIEKTAPVTYTLEDCWMSLYDLDSAYPSNVYVYCTKDANGNMTPAVLTSNLTTGIIKGNIVTVSHTLLNQDGIDPNEAVGVIKISAKLKERVSNNDAATTYSDNTNP